MTIHHPTGTVIPEPLACSKTGWSKARFMSTLFKGEQDCGKVGRGMAKEDVE